MWREKDNLLVTRRSYRHSCPSTGSRIPHSLFWHKMVRGFLPALASLYWDASSRMEKASSLGCKKQTEEEWVLPVEVRLRKDHLRNPCASMSSLEYLWWYERAIQAPDTQPDNLLTTATPCLSPLPPLCWLLKDAAHLQFSECMLFPSPKDKTESTLGV